MIYKIRKHDAAKRRSWFMFVCRDFDFLNDTLPFFKAILLEIIRCTRYFFLVHEDLKKKIYDFQ